MSGIVIFDYAAWAIRYPVLAVTVSQPLAQAYFSEAVLFLNNDEDSPVPDVVQRAMLLGMVVAHLATLELPVGGGSAGGTFIGRVNSATQGSVSIGSQFEVPMGSPQWWAITRFGAMFWVATARFRAMRYVPGHSRNSEQAFPNVQGVPWIGGYPIG
jgi:hypothetical protein